MQHDVTRCAVHRKASVAPKGTVGEFQKENAKTGKLEVMC